MTRLRTGIAWRALPLGLALCVAAVVSCDIEPKSQPLGPACTTLSDCCTAGPSDLCSDDPAGGKTCQANSYCAGDTNCFGSRFGACGALPPTPPPGSCPHYAFGMHPLTPPPFLCGGIADSTTALMTADINNLWGSTSQFCSCGSDALAAGCMNNAVVFNAPYGYGYVFFDQNFLYALAYANGGHPMAAAWLLAHESGHDVQLNFGMSYGTNVARELGADCFSGYFLQWIACEGRATASDINSALSAACGGQDPYGTPWFAPGHGTCAQRMGAVQWGMSGYASGVNPVFRCQ